MERTRMFSPDEGQPGEPKQPDLMGYASVDDLVKAKRASDGELRKMAERLQSLEAGFQQLARPQIPVRYSSPDEELSSMGVPVNALDAYVQRKLDQVLEPLARGAQARERVIARNPEYAKFEPDIIRYVNSDPELQERYQRALRTDPEIAFEYAQSKFIEHQAKQAPTQGKPSTKEAQIPTSRSGESRSVPSEDDELRQKAREYYEKTGDAKPYAQLRIRQTVSDEHLAR